MKLLIIILINTAVLAISYYLGYKNGVKDVNRKLELGGINFRVNNKTVLSVLRNKTNNVYEVAIYDSKYLDVFKVKTYKDCLKANTQ